MLAATLKPADEPRMYQKIGQSLVKCFSAQVLIAGRTPVQQATPHNRYITFLPFFHAKRISFKRLMQPFLFFFQVLKKRPAMLIVHTHELLWTALLSRIFIPGIRIVYDIQENYYANLIYANYYCGFLKYLLAGYVRFKEKCCAPFIHHFFLAEQCYIRELSFINKRYTVLENKACNPPDTNLSASKNKLSKHKLVLLFSGTLAEQTGLFQAIDFAIKLHALKPEVQLRIIGNCHIAETYRKAKQICEQYPFISWEGNRYFVSHKKITEAIYDSDFGLISYLPLPHLVNKVPSKFYEYAAARLPVVMQQAPLWNKLCNSCHAGICINYHNFDAGDTLAKMQNTHFYTGGSYDNLYWESEVPKLYHAVKAILKT